MITVVGSLNMDLFIEAPRLPLPGETVIGTGFRREAGGKGANQACAVARMAGACRLIGAVGQDPFGQELLQALAARGVDTNAVVRTDSQPTGTAFIAVDAGGQNSIVVVPGANATLRAADVARAVGHDHEHTKAVLTQLESPLETTEAALRLGREAGILTALNPAPVTDVRTLASCLQLSDWVVPNEIEAAQLTGLPVRGIAEAAKAADSLRALAGGANVVVTLGALGVWIAGNSFCGHCPAFAVEPIDTVGAGDTFIGAFIVRLTEGATPLAAARFGCAAAALAVTGRGAQASIPTRAQVEQFLASHPVQLE